MKKVLLLVLMLIAVSGCGKVVPPGVTVIILDAAGNSKIYKKGVYFAWGRDKVYFLDTKLRSFEEKMKILCADDINMDVSVKWLGNFVVTPESIQVIKSKIPAVKTNRKDISGYELSLENFYNMAVKDIVNSFTRLVISKYRTDDIKLHREEIRKNIKALVIKRLVELHYPLETVDILITNIDYPQSVTDMRKRIKQAQLKDQENAALAKAAVAKAERDAQIAQKQGEAEVIRASMKAKANKLIAESLTPNIIMLKQFEALEKLAKGPNNTVLIMPYDAIKQNDIKIVNMTGKLKVK